MKCPECDGEGGSKDYWGEWDDCPCCLGGGSCTKAHHENYVADLRAADAEIDRVMNAPCPKCGVIEGNHINKHGDPCQTV